MNEIELKEYISPAHWFSLKFPTYWSYEQTEQNLVSFFNEADGVGALQISAFEATKLKRLDPKEQLEDYLKDRLPISKLKEIKLKKNSHNEIAEIEEVSKDNYWKYCMIVNKNRLLFITYNCDIDDRDKEQHFIDQIIDSIKMY